MSEQQKEPNINNQDESSIFCANAVNKKISQLKKSYGLPSWLIFDLKNHERTCVSCNKALGFNSIRGVNVCLNAQHFGDIQVEILCNKCFSSYFIHFRNACSNINDFCDFILGKIPNQEPVLLTDIKVYQNNLTELIIADLDLKTETNTNTLME